jgi:inorganic phosphate transporter, PiT family
MGHVGPQQRRPPLRQLRRKGRQVKNGRHADQNPRVTWRGNSLRHAGECRFAGGQIDTLAAPTWAKVVCAAALTAGTALGGWRIIATVGRRIYRIRPEEGLASQTASAGVIFGSSLLGAPVSTTQVVASSVVGIGVGRRRWHHVHWSVVRNMGPAWLITMPVSAALGVLALELWRLVT